NDHFRLFSVDFIRRTDLSTSAQIMYMRWSCNADNFIQSVPDYIIRFKTSKEATLKYVKELVNAGLLIKFDIRHCHGRKPQAIVAYKAVKKSLNKPQIIRLYLSRKPENKDENFILINEAISDFLQKSTYQTSDNPTSVIKEKEKRSSKQPVCIETSSIKQKSIYQTPDNQESDNPPLSSNKVKVSNKPVSSSSSELCQEATTFKITEKALQLLTEKELDVEHELKAFDKYNGHLNDKRKPNASELFELWCEKARIEPEKKVSSRVTNPLSQSYYHEHKGKGHEVAIIEYEEGAYEGVVIDCD
ncbi:hypothetical protein ACR9PT_13600, partial [Piscirickettsia salmonis]|uniref:hypothetical protein n=1 Tax=Piscirickettsia salmonis TaxID=1238 RepID=UPI003EBC3578